MCCYATLKNGKQLSKVWTCYQGAHSVKYQSGPESIVLYLSAGIIAYLYTQFTLLLLIGEISYYFIHLSVKYQSGPGTGPLVHYTLRRDCKQTLQYKYLTLNGLNGPGLYLSAEIITGHTSHQNVDNILSHRITHSKIHIFLLRNALISTHLDIQISSTARLEAKYLQFSDFL